MRLKITKFGLFLMDCCQKFLLSHCRRGLFLIDFYFDLRLVFEIRFIMILILMF